MKSFCCLSAKLHHKSLINRKIKPILFEEPMLGYAIHLDEYPSLRHNMYVFALKYHKIITRTMLLC